MFMTSQFMRFLMAGGVAAVANVVSRVGFSHFVPLPVAVVLAYLVGMAVAFVLMRRHVFQPGAAPLWRQISAFVVVNVAAVLQTLVVTLLLADFVLPWSGVHDHADLVAHVVGVAVPIVTSFIGHRQWSFR
jgi:putative flippase GtrA